MLKKSVLAVVLLFVATNLWALGPADVSVGVHNLGSTGTYQGKATNEDEICIFCHTPHGGTLTGPLWNRNLPANTFTHYSSATLSGYWSGLSNTRPVSNESLLCMSCHDGVIAMNSIVNNSNRTGAAPNNADPMQPMFGSGSVIGNAFDSPPPVIPAGKNLSDDHPISFSYYDDFNYGTNNQRLHDITYAEGRGIRFFGPNAATGKRVECSSCHDPHVNYVANTAYTPFLVTSNAASALCLACHVK